jgi:phosphonoacetaldehyde hydrolase
MIRAVILDWAGTTVDLGSQAPAAVLRELFADFGVTITVEEARRDMGLPKKEHIQAIVNLPRIREAAPHLNVDALYEQFVPRQTEALLRYSNVIDGVPDAIAWMRSRGYRIGSSTGYTRPMMNALVPHAAAQGYSPDANICPDDVGAGRPSPWMAFANMRALDVYPPQACLKIGDTPADIDEGRNAGMWTIGIVDTGNEAGNPDRLIAAGAHLLASSVAACRDAIVEIERRIATGMHP